MRLSFITKSIIIPSAIILTLGGCSHLDRLAEDVNPPPLSAIKNPETMPGYRPVTMPMPRNITTSSIHSTSQNISGYKGAHPYQPHSLYQPNSLWKTGSRAFFKDQRAAKIGDLLTVLIDFTDSAQFNNATNRDRSGNNTLGINALGGVGKVIKKILPHTNAIDMSRLVDVNSSQSSDGNGSVNRQEQLTTQMSAIVIQRLPNGNLVIEGRQEIRLNGELRELIVAGIVRPEDIRANNTIALSKIGEARVSYGGRGDLTRTQRVRYGQRFLDAVMPF